MFPYAIGDRWLLIDAKEEHALVVDRNLRRVDHPSRWWSLRETKMIPSALVAVLMLYSVAGLVLLPLAMRHHRRGLTTTRFLVAATVAQLAVIAALVIQVGDNLMTRLFFGPG
jgi:hypothetical protein